MKTALLAILAAVLLSACETARIPHTTAPLANVEAGHGEFGGLDLTRPLWLN